MCGTGVGVSVAECSSLVGNRFSGFEQLRDACRCVVFSHHRLTLLRAMVLAAVDTVRQNSRAQAAVFDVIRHLVMNS